MVSEPIAPPWADFAAVQNRIETSRRIDYRYWGLEEALTESLDSEPGSSLTTRKFSTLRDNRAKKHRIRQRLLGAATMCRQSCTVANQHSRVDCEDVLATCMPLLNSIEQAIFRLLADDANYQAVADCVHLGLGQVKSKIHRVRKRLTKLHSEVRV